MDKNKATILRVLDGLWESYEWVPLKEIEQRVPLSRLLVKKTVRDLEKAGLLSWKRLRDSVGLKLTEKGRDWLAVRDLKNRGVLTDIGHIVGSGKEAVVVLAYNKEKKLALKFHRYYSAEFKKIQRSLSYTALRWFKEKIGRQSRPLDIARAKASIEFRALKTLWPKVSVPCPLAKSRHVVAMEFIGDALPAPLLSRAGPEPGLKTEILSDYEKAIKLGVVHGELGPYNIMVQEKAYLIDWPQSVPVAYPGARELIEKDKKRIEDFFSGV